MMGIPAKANTDSEEMRTAFRAKPIKLVARELGRSPRGAP